MKGLIRFCYCKRIDAASAKPWDKVVFDETYQEFFMQAQFYNQAGTYQTFQQLLNNVPNADRLHYLTSRVAMGYLQQLRQTIPNVVNALGRECLPFTQFKFEIVASHLERKDAHEIALFFYSDPLTWVDTIGNQLLIAYSDPREASQAPNERSSDLIALQPNLSIWSYQP